MPHFVKSIVLSAVLLASVAASAYAQSASVAALPSANQGRPPAAAPPIGPTADEVAFPDGPRDIWNNMAKMAVVAPSPFLGRAPNADSGEDSDE